MPAAAATALASTRPRPGCHQGWRCVALASGAVPASKLSLPCLSSNSFSYLKSDISVFLPLVVVSVVVVVLWRVRGRSAVLPPCGRAFTPLLPQGHSTELSASAPKRPSAFGHRTRYRLAAGSSATRNCLGCSHASGVNVAHSLSVHLQGSEYPRENP